VEDDADVWCYSILELHVRNDELVPLKSLGAVTNSPSIVTMAVSVAVFFFKYLVSKNGVTKKAG